MDQSLSTKIRFEEAYQGYLDCLKKPPQKNPECKEIIKRYHYLLEKHHTNNIIMNHSIHTNVSNNKY
jgi:hypothetical protein